MKRVRSFAPLVTERARVLILGSMPGRASLAAHRYYAHPQNRFWPIMSQLLGLPVDAAYEVRVQALGDAGIAVWDVLRSCVREGSLDADIENDTLEVNDFAGFLEQYPSIEAIFFNGAKAHDCFRRNVRLPERFAGLKQQRLPSTSPAHASLRFEEKLAAWRVVTDRIPVC